MNKIALLLFGLIYTFSTKAQSVEFAKPYPDSVRNRISKSVNLKAIKFKKSLVNEDLTSAQITYSVDTFKIWVTNNERQDYDFSTEGMNNSVLEMADSYDKLMNKYYSKLLNALDATEKKVLITAQKQWLKYRDAEKVLIFTMENWKYNTGGNIQSNFAVSNYFDLIKTRVDQIFLYYNGIVEKQELEKSQ
jgi:uncharacterized protein YecT (DUF1311 family)